MPNIILPEKLVVTILLGLERARREASLPETVGYLNFHSQ
jgi:hypothetical protein